MTVLTVPCEPIQRLEDVWRHSESHRARERVLLGLNGEGAC